MTSTSADAAPRPGIAALFLGFLGIGLIGFGGVLPWARRMVVEQRGWLTAGEFTDLLALCQFLPGPNVVNLAVTLGSRFRGPVGALATLAGLLGGPIAVVIALGMLYARFADLAPVRHGLAGLAAAASGLVVAMAVKIAAPLRRDLPGAGVAVIAFIVIAVLRAPLLPAMLVLAPASVALAWALRFRTTH
jgi:chromate transporter